MSIWRLAFVALAVLVVSGTLPGMAQQPGENGGWGTLSDGATWQRIEDGTTADLAAVSALVRVSRKTYRFNPASDSFAASGGFCFDIHTGGPAIFLVERGGLPWSFYDQQSTVDALPDTGLALLVRAADQGEPPVVVAPDTALRLAPGDMVVGHHGTSCSVRGNAPEVTFLDVQGLPSGPGATSLLRYGIEVEALDPDIDLPTARPLAPASVVVGRLTVPPGGSVALDASTMPVLFTVEQGAFSVTTSVDGGIVLSGGVPSALRPEDPVTFTAGDSGYIPPGPVGAVTNAGEEPAVALSVAVIPGAATSTTP